MNSELPAFVALVAGGRCRRLLGLAAGVPVGRLLVLLRPHPVQWPYAAVAVRAVLRETADVKNGRGGRLAWWQRER